MTSSSSVHVWSRVAWIVPVCFMALVTSTSASGLDFVEEQRDGVGRQPDAVAVSSDDGFVYAASHGDSTVAVFGRDAITGALTFVEQQEDGTGGVVNMAEPTGIAMSADGGCLYVTSFTDDAVVVFSRNLVTGTLTFVESQRNGVGGVAGLKNATAVAVSPVGSSVYVTGQEDDSVVVFSRSTCALTFVEREQDGVGGTNGLARPVAIALSPDGKNAYVAGQGDEGVAVFSRDLGTGELTFVQAELDGVGGVNGIGRCSGVTVSPDGANVYATGEHDNAVATFERDAATGALTFRELDRDGQGEVQGIKGAKSPVVSSDGSAVYVAGEFSDAVASFSRDPMNAGALTFFESHKDNTLGFDGLAGVYQLALTQDGKSLYSAARGENAVGVLRISVCGDGALGSNEQCDDGNVASGDGCSATCHLEGCPAMPQSGCIHARAHGASVTLKNVANDAADSLSWTYHGGATPVAALGNPVTTTGYLFCVYDSSGAPQPRIALAAPNDGMCRGKPCWKGVSSFNYLDLLMTPDGLRQVMLRAGSSSHLVFKGKGAHLFEHASTPPFLPLTLPVRMQVANSIGTCWDSVFSSAGTNDAGAFKGKSD